MNNNGNMGSVQLLDCYPAKAQYDSGSKVTLLLELLNGTGEERAVTVRCTVWELDAMAEQQEWVLMLPADDVPVGHRMEVGPFVTDRTGYGVEVELLENGAAAGRAATAFDVVSDWRLAPRYGFLSDFGAEELGDRSDVDWMAKLHLNLVQFYDWMYRHDELVSDEEEYTDLMGRKVSRPVVEEKIALCHEHGMKAIAYGAIYAASKTFADRHPEWRLYTSAGEPYDFIGIFNIMNISPDSPWHGHIVQQYRETVERLDFDGIHMDTYGFPKTGWSRLGGTPRLERLEEQFPLLIEATREELTQVREDICLIFNNVGNWPVDTVATANQDAIYVEVWKPYERYHQLREIIHAANRHSGGKPVILAAYLKPFREPGAIGEAGAEHAFRLLNATVTAQGAYHLLHGEYGGVLTQGYYVDHSKLRQNFMRTVRDYADFGVRYGHVLHDERLRDVSMTHADGDNLEYSFSGFPYSTYGEAGKVWTVIREHAGLKLIHFINLAASSDDYWNESKEAPREIQGRTVSVAVDGEVAAVLLATPDEREGAPLRLDYREETTARGRCLVMELPPLLYWDMLIVRMKDE
ncbi:glycoside hydrolase family 66 protein [Paenibacillus chungangensis]|uniref:Glycoside hydrolase family 66 protein n=1 Tax=Paenibacillus chungangensis TaxID=696535 RepID=A0ABW3HKS9_9BACL